MTTEISSAPASSPSAPIDRWLRRALFGPRPVQAGTPGTPRAPVALIALPMLVWLGERLLVAGSFGPALPGLVLAIAISIIIIRRRFYLLPAIFLVIAVLGLVETVNFITVGFGLVALTVFAIPPDRFATGSDGARLAVLARFLGFGPFRAPFHVWRAVVAEGSAGGFRAWVPRLLMWLWPLAVGLGFLALFSYANPFIAGAFARLNPILALSTLSGWQILLWFILGCGVWPFLRADAMAGHATATTGPARLVPATSSVLRVLAVSNAVFAVQTATDLANLWPGVVGLGGGLVLPEGKTFAEYAHEGAYPLLVAAGLAAAIILAVMREGVPASRHPRTRRLVYLWVAQTLLLLASAALRLDLYVDAHALTRLRLYAFIWMGLVAAGLVLIVARMVLDRSNAWLVRVNLVMLATTLALCGLANLDRLIATYNLDHSDLVVAEGPPLDIAYLHTLGADAVPAVSRILANIGTAPDDPDAGATLDALKGFRDSQLQCLAADLADWRTWSFRKWRLKRSYDDGVSLAPSVE